MLLDKDWRKISVKLNRMTKSIDKSIDTLKYIIAYTKQKIKEKEDEEAKKR